MPTSPMALYYPWMHFQDDSWLKLSLLTWDKLVRVRPRSIDRDNDLVRCIRGETGLLVDVVPREKDLQLVSDAFTRVIYNYRTRISEEYNIGGACGPDVEFRSPYSQRVYGYSPITVRRGTTSQGPASTASYPDSELTWVYSGPRESKMGIILREHLIDLGVAAQAPDEGPWVGMRPRLASIYLAALADAVATHNDLAPTTDDPRMHSAVGSIDQLTDLLIGGNYEQPQEDPAGIYVHLALQSVLEPRNLDTIPVDKLISFRQRHEDELRAFWGHVSGLSDELAHVSTVDNPELARLHMQEIYDIQTKPMLHDLQRGLLAYGIDTVAGSMALKINISAASGTALGAAAAAGGHVVFGAASVALSVVPYFIAKARQANARRAASPVAYLLAANRNLSGKGLLNSLR